MINIYKYNVFTTAVIKTAFKLFCKNVEKFVFVASTGRSGTNTIQLLFTTANKAYACHEDHPVMNGETMIQFNNNLDNLMIREFNSRKLLRIMFHSFGKKYYIETNHMFIKCFYPEAVKLFQKRLHVIALTRDPIKVAISLYGRENIPGHGKGNEWYLDPQAPRNIINANELLFMDSRFSHNFFKCLWYAYEIRARITKFKQMYPEVHVTEIETSQLNNIEAVTNMFAKIGIDYDEAKLKSLVGIRANSTPQKKKINLNVSDSLIEEFSRLCELKTNDRLQLPENAGKNLKKACNSRSNPAEKQTIRNLGAYNGRKGLDLLLQETEKICARKRPVVIGLTGCPGSGKTFLAKCFTRFGFGPFPKSAVKVIDDNIIYTTRLWRLHWEKINPDKTTWKDFVNAHDHKILIFSNWFPSRFIDSVDILINITVNESERLTRLGRKYRTRPHKIARQLAKNTVPLENPFTYEIMMTYSDPDMETRLWMVSGWLKRWLKRPFNR